MSAESRLNHKGIFYSVISIGVRQWEWRVSPPAGVRGLHDEVGMLTGEQTDAVTAAQQAIERQIGRFQ
jgi:hypothetical protein